MQCLLWSWVPLLDSWGTRLCFTFLFCSGFCYCYSNFRFLHPTHKGFWKDKDLLVIVFFELVEIIQGKGDLQHYSWQSFCPWGIPAYLANVSCYFIIRFYFSVNSIFLQLELSSASSTHTNTNGSLLVILPTTWGCNQIVQTTRSTYCAAYPPSTNKQTMTTVVFISEKLRFTNTSPLSCWQDT